MRPGSRGGYPNVGASGYGTAVPGVGARPGSGMGMRPMSGRLGTGRVGTGRVGTGRLGTGQAGPVYGGVGLNTDVRVADRPVTQQGMVGIHKRNNGPGRQVEDASYYAGLLRHKNSELTAEVAKMKTEIEQHHKDSTTYQQLERKYESLIKEVRSLEGNLADYNLAMDKSRTSTDPREIHSYFYSLRHKNEHEAKEIDNIFLQRQDRDRATQRLEGEIGQLQQAAAAKMNTLSPDKLELYKTLTNDNRRFAAMIAEKQAELEQLNAHIGEMEEELKSDSHREEFARLDRQLARARKERDDLREEVRETELDPAQAREKLLAKAREDNERLVQLTERLKQVQAEVNQKQKVLSDLATDMEERRGEAGDSHKYEVLHQRDQEMTQFIERLPEEKKSQLQDQKNTQANIVALLEHMSKTLEKQQALPNKAKVSDMREDISFKTKAMESAQTTHSRLLAELAKRNSELEKIETLDSKISVELNSLNSKIKSMHEEMTELQDIDSLKSKAEATKARLSAKKTQYLRRRDMIRQQVRLLSAQYEKKKNMLAENETAKSFEASEQRLRNYEQKIFQIREYIETKGSETQYEQLSDECQQLTDDINAHVIRAQATMTASLVNTAAPY